jgi:hypothetical protein
MHTGHKTFKTFSLVNINDIDLFFKIRDVYRIIVPEYARNTRKSSLFRGESRRQVVIRKKIGFCRRRAAVITRGGYFANDGATVIAEYTIPVTFIRQDPREQVLPAAHVWPQKPQLDVSFEKSTQAPLQQFGAAE